MMFNPGDRVAINYYNSSVAYRGTVAAESYLLDGEHYVLVRQDNGKDVPAPVSIVSLLENEIKVAKNDL